MPLYKINTSGNRASDAMAKAAGTFANMQQSGGSTTTGKSQGPGPTAGGAIMSGLAGVGAGAGMMAAGGASATVAGALGGPLGIGALAIGAYLFS